MFRYQRGHYKSQENSKKQIGRWHNRTASEERIGTMKPFRAMLRNPTTPFEYALFGLVLAVLILPTDASEQEKTGEISATNSGTGGTYSVDNSNLIPSLYLHMASHSNDPSVSESSGRSKEKKSTEPKVETPEKQPVNSKEESELPRPKNFKISRRCFAAIQEIAPEKLNWPIGRKLVSTAELTQFSAVKYVVGSPEHKAELARQHKLQIFSDQMDKVLSTLGAKLNKELSERAQSDPILCMDDVMTTAVNAVYQQIQNLVHGIHDAAIQIAVAKNFHGGTCHVHASIAAITALKSGQEVEMVELLDKHDINHTHIFAVIGRKAGSKLEDPLTWGEDATIIDGWAHDGPITIPQLKKDPQKYGLYFSKNWRWETRLLTTKIPAHIKENFYYKTYGQLRSYVTYCFDLIKEYVTNGVELPQEQPSMQMRP